jgi:ketosteroid isomerase-like protein
MPSAKFPSHPMISFFARVVIFIAGATGCLAQNSTVAADRGAMEKTMAGITAAFANGDLAAIASYHHPQVEKALSYTKVLKGRDAVLADLRGTLAAYTLTFVEHKVESLEFFGDTCVEQSTFTVRGEPKQSSPPFTFRGRAMVVYVRYAGSPSGWASIREMVQPASE